MHKNDYLDDAELLNVRLRLSCINASFFTVLYISSSSSQLLFTLMDTLFCTAKLAMFVSIKIALKYMVYIANSSESTGNYLCSVQTCIPLTEFAGIGHSNW